MHKRFFDGFTIVELLIVIVIIGIIATIGVVAYQGVQERGFDTAVQTDLTKFADELNIYYSDNGHYPLNSAELGSITGVKFTKGSYDTSTHAVTYCTTTTTGSEMIVVAQSRSTKRFSIKNEEPVKASALPNSSCYGQLSSSEYILVYSGYTGQWMSNF